MSVSGPAQNSNVAELLKLGFGGPVMIEASGVSAGGGGQGQQPEALGHGRRRGP